MAIWIEQKRGGYVVRWRDRQTSHTSPVMETRDQAVAWAQAFLRGR